MREQGYNRILLISTFVAFFSVTISLIDINMHPTKGYEISNYSSTPLLFWISMIYGILNGIFILMLNMTKLNRKIWRIIGLFDILLCEFLLLIVYGLRGYVYLERGDTLTYIGMVHDINIYGQILDYNFYPSVSILISQINQISGVSILELARFLPASFFVLYILFIYCWARSIISNENFVYCTVISSTPFFFAYFSTTIFHMLLAVYMLPLLFYTIKKSNTPSYIVLELILFVSSIFFHPIVASFILIYLLAYFIVSDRLNYEESQQNLSVNSLIIFLVSLLIWILMQQILYKEMSHVVLTILGDFETTTTFASANSYTQKLSLSSILHAIIPLIDDSIFYLLFITSMYYLRKEKNIIIKGSILTIACVFLVGTIFLAAMFIAAYIHNPIRLLTLNQNIIFLIPIVGYLLYSMLNKKRYYILSCVLLLVIISQIFSIFSIYQSPLIMLPNDQITSSEIHGMDWIISNKNVTYQISDVMSPVSRYSDLNYGYMYTKKRLDLYRESDFSNHFNFSEKNVFPLEYSKYLVVTEYDIQAYTKVWKESNRFNEDDFNKINMCTNVNKIYTNKLLNSYFVRAA